VLGEIPLASAALFDLGVYFTVVGSTLLTLSALGNATKSAPPHESGARSRPSRTLAGEAA
jgi:multicomponent K+:H+ antiporter subunit A